MSSSKGGGVYGTKGDTGFRRTWDKDEYAKKAVLRQAGQLKRTEETERVQRVMDEDARRAEAGEKPLVPSLITARDGDLGFAASVGKTVVVDTSDGTQPGFHCALCDRTYKDNMTFLDHLNSIQHLKAAGYAPRAQRSTVEQVRARLLFHKQAKNAPKVTVDFRAEREKRRAAEEQEKTDRRDRKKKAKQDAKDAHLAALGEGIDDDMAAVMGFGGFGSSKPAMASSLSAPLK
ncbi:hypothetical protein BC831DRAFT_432001 [Entophlyctis helioformis]|nr:hypothetical protein BC831DRAFT_432001 [Entophlyctis helioformis]